MSGKKGIHRHPAKESERKKGSEKKKDDQKHDPDLLKYGFHCTRDLLETRRKNDFFAKPKYQNKLPDLPCDPKHLVIMPLTSQSFDLPLSQMQPFYEQLVGSMCGVTVDLVGGIGSTYNSKPPGMVKLDPEDLFLLEDDTETEKRNKLKRSITHKKSVAWLHRTEYISAEPAKYKTQHGDKIEFRMDKAISKNLAIKDKMGILDISKHRLARLQSIENTFEQARQPITEHFSEPGVYAKEILPVFPDFPLEKLSFVQIGLPSGSLGKIDEEEMSQAMLQPISYVGDEQDIERIGYFVPMASSEDQEDGEQAKTKEYLLARDFVFQQDATKLSSILDTYVFFMEKEETLSYCKIDKRLKLNRPIKAEPLRENKGNITLRVTYVREEEKDLKDEEKDLSSQEEEDVEKRLPPNDENLLSVKVEKGLLISKEVEKDLSPMEVEKDLYLNDNEEEKDIPSEEEERELPPSEIEKCLPANEVETDLSPEEEEKDFLFA